MNHDDKTPTTPPQGRPPTMMKYAIPVLALIGGGGGVGGFLGSQSTTAEMSRVLDEVRADVKDIQRQFVSGDKAAALLERDVSELRTQVAEMKERLEKMERRR